MAPDSDPPPSESPIKGSEVRHPLHEDRRSGHIKTGKADKKAPPPERPQQQPTKKKD